MKKRRMTTATLVLTALATISASAQQIPFLSDLLSRSEEFYRLYNEKRHAGANLAAIEPLRKRGEQAFLSGNIPGLIEMMGEGKALLQGQPFDIIQRFLTSLTIEADRLVMEPNQDLHVALLRIYPVATEKTFAATPTVTFEVIPVDAAAQQAGNNSLAAGRPKPLVIAERLPIGENISNAAIRLRLTDGAYWIVARIQMGAQSIGEIRKPLYALSDFSDNVSQLSKRVADIKSSTDAKVKAVASLVATPEFQLQRVAALSRSRGEVEINPVLELDRIDAYLTALVKGQNPFANERGEVERAYRAADGALIPYRLYVPLSYDGQSARPMVVLLHGVLGDERYYFSYLFDPAIVKGEAERRGYILASVNGRGRTSGYQGVAVDDSFEVIKAVTQVYKIDASRIYLTGHSMGGFGTWMVAASKPEVFAAIAPLSSGAPAQGAALSAMLAKLKALPVLIVHGARDGIVPPERSRLSSEAAQKAGLKVSYLEIPEADHLTIIGDTFTAVMDFFEKNPKPGK